MLVGKFEAQQTSVLLHTKSIQLFDKHSKQRFTDGESSKHRSRHTLSHRVHSRDSDVEKVARCHLISTIKTIDVRIVHSGSLHEFFF